MNRITAITAPGDNYVWCITDKEKKYAAVIDPGVTEPVIRYLAEKGLTLIGIFITHHHHDHMGGVRGLLARNRVPVYGPAHEKSIAQAIPLGINDHFQLEKLDLNFQIMETPGHTSGHIVYMTEVDNVPVIFTGDTLFSSGCGRVFEGTYAQMYCSLLKLKALPGRTLVYSGHEYLRWNLSFARHVEPENRELEEYAQRWSRLLINGNPGIPTTISEEWQFNPFFRCDRQAIHQAVTRYKGFLPGTEEEVFTVLRKWKNSF